MNCFNTVGKGMHHGIPIVIPTVTITGSNYTRSPSGTTLTSGTTYTYKFTGGVNTFNCNFPIATMYVIVVGAGGDSTVGTINYYAPGGAGGGAGALTMSYAANTIYDISAAQVSTNYYYQAAASSSFKNSSGYGVTSTGGWSGARSSTVAAVEGTSTCTLPGNFVSTSGGNGGIYYGTNGNGNGSNSSGDLITIGATTYKYGGGGKAGYYTTTITGGGNAGLNGIGATTFNTTNSGVSATSPGSGAGGGRFDGGSSQISPKGGRGEVIIIFTYNTLI